ncbi:MAG: globin [Sulfurovum sp.]|nr:globin [Sulfurovum sp.]
MATKKEILALPMTSVEKGKPVHFKNPPKAFFDAIGGEEGMKELMFDFYNKIYESKIAHFFPQDEEAFEEVKKKNTKFFVQICGGPKVYEGASKGMNLNEYMIRLHDDFSINENNRVEWLGTMREALVDKAQHVDIEPIKMFWEYLECFSKLTVNTFADGSTYYAAYTQAREDK